MAGLKLDELEAADRIARLADDTLLTAAEAAVFLRCSEKTLERMRARAGDGPPFHQLSGRQKETARVFYQLGDLKRWIDAHKHQSQAERAKKSGM